MNPSAAHRAILRSASLLVRTEQRAEWLAEWQSELWHAERDRKPAQLTAFCLGAFRDAFWLRHHSPIHQSLSILQLDYPEPPVISDDAPEWMLLESPVWCLSVLTALAATALCVALTLPTARNLILASPYPDERNLVILDFDRNAKAAANGFFNPFPSIPFGQFSALKEGFGNRFAGLAFYWPIHMHAGTSRILIARTSPELFRLLNIPLPPTRGHEPLLLLSQAAWQNHFGADPQIVGRHLQLNGQPSTVSGILTASQWTLSSNLDGWLVENETAIAAIPANAEGFALARLNGAPPTVDTELGRLNFVALPEHGRWPVFRAMLFEFCFGCLLIPIATSLLSLGDYPRAMPARWLFLAAKTVLVFLIVLIGALDMASLGSWFEPGILSLTAFGALFAMRWVITDQQRRCPVCLRLLANPVRIGGSSHILLEWHGTELICLRGHGLLHVPERPTIWFTRQRWLDLDPSWSEQFSASK